MKELYARHLCSDFRCASSTSGRLKWSLTFLRYERETENARTRDWTLVQFEAFLNEYNVSKFPGTTIGRHSYRTCLLSALESIPSICIVKIVDARTSISAATCECISRWCARERANARAWVRGGTCCGFTPRNHSGNV